MKNKIRIILALLVGVATVGSRDLRADLLAEQQLTLNPGWNAVYLEVQPEPRDCDSVFAGLPIESVWYWDPDTITAQYIDIPPAPEELESGKSNWLAYFPPSRSEHIITSLFSIYGACAYLIKLDSEVAVEWTVEGTVCLPEITWLPDSYNLVGFNVGAGGGPLFENFFSSSPAHADLSIYELDEVSGNWQRIQYPAVTMIEAGRAYWIYCAGPSEFTGSMEVEAGIEENLYFGKEYDARHLRIKNTSDADTVFQIQSLGVPRSADPNAEIVGVVPLLIKKYDPNDPTTAEWMDMPETLEIAASAQKGYSIELAVDRSRLTEEADYGSMLEITSLDGMRMTVTATATGDDQSGLWVGTVWVDRVNEPADLNNRDTLKPTGSSFQFRLILHKESDSGNTVGKVRLLNEVIQMYKEAELIDPPNQIIDDSEFEGYQWKMADPDNPGYYVLLTDESLIPQYLGASIRDGKPKGRRISSAVFPFDEPQEMDGLWQIGDLQELKDKWEINEPEEEEAWPMNRINRLVREVNGVETVLTSGGVYRCSFTIGSNHPLNPFKHKYHPDHDNLNPDGDFRAEAYEVTREIVIIFTDEDPQAADSPGWGGDERGGVYLERINGLHKRPLYVEGIFRMDRMSPVDVLNDGSN